MLVQVKKFYTREILRGKTRLCAHYPNKVVRDYVNLLHKRTSFFRRCLTRCTVHSSSCTVCVPAPIPDDLRLTEGCKRRRSGSTYQSPSCTCPHRNRFSLILHQWCDVLHLVPACFGFVSPSVFADAEGVPQRMCPARENAYLG